MKYDKNEKKEFKCMNCGKALDPKPGLYGKRFCNERCYQEYTSQ